MRDLLGVNNNPAKDFPQDDSGYGFDNIGDVLSLSPVLMEQYLAAAEKEVHLALFGPGKVPLHRDAPSAASSLRTDGGDNSRFAGQLPFTLTDYDVTGLALPSALHATHYFPAEGEYDFPDRPGRQPPAAVGSVYRCRLDRWQAGGEDRQFRRSSKTPRSSAVSKARTRQCASIYRPASTGLRYPACNMYDGLPAKYKGNKPNMRAGTAGAGFQCVSEAEAQCNAGRTEAELEERRHSDSEAARAQASADYRREFPRQFRRDHRPVRSPTRSRLRRAAEDLRMHHAGPACARKIVCGFRASRLPAPGDA